MTIDRATWIALRPRSDKRVVVHSLDFKAAAEFNLDSLKKGRETWAEYIKGVAWVLQNAGHKLHGWDGVVVSNVPIGAGLSSSVALELATARTFAMVSVLQWNAAEMARLCLHSTGSFRVARNNLFIGDAGCTPFRK
jgi:galactokinase